LIKKANSKLANYLNRNWKKTLRSFLEELEPEISEKLVQQAFDKVMPAVYSYEHLRTIKNNDDIKEKMLDSMRSTELLELYVEQLRKPAQSARASTTGNTTTELKKSYEEVFAALAERQLVSGESPDEKIVKWAVDHSNLFIGFSKTAYRRYLELCCDLFERVLRDIFYTRQHADNEGDEKVRRRNKICRFLEAEHRTTNKENWRALLNKKRAQFDIDKDSKKEDWKLDSLAKYIKALQDVIPMHMLFNHTFASIDLMIDSGKGKWEIVGKKALKDAGVLFTYLKIQYTSELVNNPNKFSSSSFARDILYYFKFYEFISRDGFSKKIANAEHNEQAYNLYLELRDLSEECALAMPYGLRMPDRLIFNAICAVGKGEDRERILSELECALKKTCESCPHSELINEAVRTVGSKENLKGILNELGCALEETCNPLDKNKLIKKAGEAIRAAKSEVSLETLLEKVDRALKDTCNPCIQKELIFDAIRNAEIRKDPDEVISDLNSVIAGRLRENDEQEEKL